MTTPEKEMFLEHWRNIGPERLARYETMYQWTPAADAFYAPADIRAGQVIADFGCGPGHTAIEFAHRVGPAGHVHALDINAEFIDRTRARAKAAGLARRITAHLLTTEDFPLPDAALDRVTARNTIIYVRDPVATFQEFRRVLKPRGLAHAIESDWSLTAVEPLGARRRRVRRRAVLSGFPVTSRPARTPITSPTGQSRLLRVRSLRPGRTTVIFERREGRWLASRGRCSVAHPDGAQENRECEFLHTHRGTGGAIISEA
jgi:SAM-dependent methyltransferase